MRVKMIKFVVEGSAPFPFPIMAVERASFVEPDEVTTIHTVRMIEIPRPGKRKPEMRPANRRITLIKVTPESGPREKRDPQLGMPNVRLWQEYGYRVDRGSIKPYTG